VKAPGVRLAAAALLASLAIIIGGAVAPAQQFPHTPGNAEPTMTPGAPTPAPIPSLFASPSPAPFPSGESASPGAGAAPPSSAPAAPHAGTGAAPVSTKAPIVRFTGELLDVRNGYVFFTTADAFKASPDLKIVDFDSGGPTQLVPAPRLYARATLDPATGAIVELALTKRKLPTDAAYQQAYEQAHSYAVKGSPRENAPELAHQARMTGRPVAVTFLVQVPPTTPLTDSVYISTDASGWIANAMKMDRIDALHYRLTRTYASGTMFAYRYTRGSWNSVEVGEDGLQGDAHAFLVPEVDAKLQRDNVFRWSDQNPAEPNVGPDSIPTPFNPNPFGGFPTKPLPNGQNPGIPPASPTPRP
jgi:hypothetical protein